MNYARISTLALGAALAVSASSAFAADEGRTGFYAGLNAGLTQVEDTEVQYVETDPAADGTVETTATIRSGKHFGGVIGYDFGRVRTDVELGYTQSTVESLNVDSIDGQEVTIANEDRAAGCAFFDIEPCGGSGTGNRFYVNGVKARQLTALANVWGEVPISKGVTPYIGGGIGVHQLEVDGEKADNPELAWQLGAGIALDITKNAKITLDYRYRNAKGVTIETGDTSGMIVDDVETSIFSVGFRVYM